MEGATSGAGRDSTCGGGLDVEGGSGVGTGRGGGVTAGGAGRATRSSRRLRSLDPFRGRRCGRRLSGPGAGRAVAPDPGFPAAPLRAAAPRAARGIGRSGKKRRSRQEKAANRRAPRGSGTIWQTTCQNRLAHRTLVSDHSSSSRDAGSETGRFAISFLIHAGLVGLLLFLARPPLFPDRPIRVRLVEPPPVAAPPESRGPAPQPVPRPVPKAPPAPPARNGSSERSLRDDRVARPAPPAVTPPPRPVPTPEPPSTSSPPAAGGVTAGRQRSLLPSWSLPATRCRSESSRTKWFQPGRAATGTNRLEGRAGIAPGG